MLGVGREYNFILHNKTRFNWKLVKGNLLEIYEQLRHESFDKESFLLRLGWGSGFDSMTVNLKQQKPRSVQTRKLVDNVLPPGWTKVKIIDKK